MGKKDHASFSDYFEKKFSELLGFEKCGLLVADVKNGYLYKITIPYEDEDKISSGVTFDGIEQIKPILVRYPKDRGITS